VWHKLRWSGGRKMHVRFSSLLSGKAVRTCHEKSQPKQRKTSVIVR